ncbi:hypothetical protein HMF8227_01789 [Saliniradius amylolyticus]|uniref:Histidine kinase domain-containing protein n=1 Tax=Saliniradius amylolyticus TaxID=2183582 RepID=A0A2S2E423_9ALTE|nr:HAMP domain-containing sensor histidine kinase [Saliniradius amylolyticus]AWL12262.1 hypothetical protein HMF8227_01789 [Saliniradius amylolyticus]
MHDSSDQIDFSSVLAAGVHDMKNSLCLLLQSIESLNELVPKDAPEANENLARLHYEASRVNTGLMQLLSLYRAEKQRLPLNIDEHVLEDVVDDIIATHEGYMHNRGLSLEVEQQDPELTWFMDADLVIVLLNDILVNAMRYCRKQIKLTTYVEDDQLCFLLEDDGDGYPEQMLKAGTADMQHFDISSGRTGLGLFFARMIASAHQNNGVRGSIQMENGGSLGGSRFLLKLP